MKNYILYLVLFCFSITLFSQEETEEKDYFSSKHELNFNVFGGTNNPFPYYYYYDIYDYYDYYFLQNINNNNIGYGFGYKMHFKNSAIRASILASFDSDKHSYEDTDDIYDLTEYESEYEYLTGIFSIGYESHKNFKRTQIFFGIDVSYKLYSFDYKSERETTHLDDPIYLYLTESKNSYKRTGYGIAPLLGVKYYITPHISLSTETHLNFEYYTGKHKNEYKSQQIGQYGSSLDDDESSSKDSGINSKLGPVGHISICVHF